LIGFSRQASLAAAPLADFDQAQIAFAYQQFSDAFDKGTFFFAGPVLQNFADQDHNIGVGSFPRKHLVGSTHGLFLRSKPNRFFVIAVWTRNAPLKPIRSRTQIIGKGSVFDRFLAPHIVQDGSYHVGEPRGVVLIQAVCCQLGHMFLD
jgi:hypothetical protein